MLAYTPILLLGFLASVTLAAPSAVGAYRCESDPETPSVEIRLSSRSGSQSRFSVLRNGGAVRSGDEIRIEMQASGETHAYVFHRGSSGEWTLLFPNAGPSMDPDEENPLNPGQICVVPGATSRLIVDRRVGDELIFFYVMPEPDSELEEIAFRLRRGERIRMFFPDDEDQPGPEPRMRREPDGDAGMVRLQLAMRDLAFVPAGNGGGLRLPARSAVLFHFRHSSTAGMQPGAELELPRLQSQSTFIMNKEK